VSGRAGRTALGLRTAADGVKPSRGRAETDLVPNLLAMMIASLGAWLVRDALPTTGGLPLPTLIGFCVWIVIFPIAKRYLTDIRPDS